MLSLTMFYKVKLLIDQCSRRTFDIFLSAIIKTIFSSIEHLIRDTDLWRNSDICVRKNLIHDMGRFEILIRDIDPPLPGPY